MMHALLLFALTTLLPFEEGGKWGYRSDGKVVLPPRYEIALEFSREGIAAVVDGEGWAYIDTAGRTLVRPLVVDNGPDDFREGLARFRRDGKVGFFNRRGTVVIPPVYSFALPFSEGRAAVCNGCEEVPKGEHRKGEHRVIRGGAWGYVDGNGTLVIPLQFAQAGEFRNGRARVRVGADWKVIGRDGKTPPRNSKEKNLR